MSFLDAFLIGLVQGISEFIPVSSTAHIVIVAYLLDIETPGLSFEIFLHVASLLAIILYFRADLIKLLIGCVHCLKKNRSDEDLASLRFCIYLGIATVITGVLGLVLVKVLGDEIKSPLVVGSALMLTALLLVFVEWIQNVGKRDESSLNVLDSVLVGLAQTIAVVPGLSRSGTTLVACLALRMNRETSVRFAFLLAIPVLAGTSLLALKDLSTGELASLGYPALAFSFIVSFLASLASIAWLIRLLKQKRLYWFSIYLVGLAVFVWVAQIGA